MKSRRNFLVTYPLSVMAVTTLRPSLAADVPASTPGAPPTFGTMPAVGPEVSAVTFAEAEKLVQVTMSESQRDMAALSWRTSMPAMLERRTGPRKVALEDSLAPATQWNPVLPGAKPGPPLSDRFIRSKAASLSLPTNDADIAFAPVSQLSRWVEAKLLSSERLTRIYLARIARLDPQLRSAVPLTSDHALDQA